MLTIKLPGLSIFFLQAFVLCPCVRNTGYLAMQYLGLVLIKLFESEIKIKIVQILTSGITVVFAYFQATIMPKWCTLLYNYRNNYRSPYLLCIQYSQNYRLVKITRCTILWGYFKSVEELNGQRHFVSGYIKNVDTHHESFS